jgi:hypothetical protein
MRYGRGAGGEDMNGDFRLDMLKGRRKDVTPCE